MKWNPFSRHNQKYLLLLAVLGLGACSDPAEEGPNKLTVAATVGMVGNLVEEVAGDSVDVFTLVGEGVDPHVYQPTTNDIKKMQGADIIFYVGLNLEGKMGEVLESLRKSGKTVVAIGPALLESGYETIMESAEETDPHLWMDVAAWSLAVPVIEKTLTQSEPESAEAFQTSSAALQEKLVSLDAYAKETMTTVPEAQRVLVTAHDAFGYLGRAYGIEVRGIQGISTESEAGVRDIEDLVDFLTERKIPSVFVESSVSDKNVVALIEGAKAKGHDLSIGGELFSDAMGPSGTYEGTYLGMIDHNITTIANALGGTAPVGGWQGKLSKEE